MIVDTSAVMAIVRREPGYERVVDALADSRSSRMSAATLVELSVVLWRRYGATEPEIRARLAELDITVTEMSDDEGWTGADTYRRFGPGSGTGARLNLGDCFSYALARRSGESLLFVGDDFDATDIPGALAAPTP